MSARKTMSTRRHCSTVSNVRKDTVINVSKNTMAYLRNTNLSEEKNWISGPLPRPQWISCRTVNNTPITALNYSVKTIRNCVVCCVTFTIIGKWTPFLLFIMCKWYGKRKLIQIRRNAILLSRFKFFRTQRYM